MSDFNNDPNNGYNNLPSPDNQNSPDYSYNWNGSEYNRTKKKKSRLVFLIIGIVAAVIVIASAAAVLLIKNAGLLDYDIFGDILESGADNSIPVNGANDNSHTQNFVVPEFTAASDADNDRSNIYTEIYENCSPSCCTIRVTYRNQGGYAIGSGFVIDAQEGYIVTNHHVIENGHEIKVIFYDGTEYTAELINSDSITDLAVLKIEAEGLKQVSFGKSENVKVGEYVVAIGTPYAETLSGTMTSGIVSGIARDIDITNASGKVVKTMTLLQTDCSINPGNSGGALFDMSGNVIGITSLKLVDEQFEGIGFAIPITSALEVVTKLIAGEDIGESNIATASAQLGITAYQLDAGFQKFRMNPRCDYPEGVLVGTIDTDAAAYKAGIQHYDIITDFNGSSVASLEDLKNELDKYRAGQEVEITVFRFNRFLTSGEYYTYTFKLDAAE